MNKGKIVMQGMGGFLCPPGHPMHKQSVETDLRRRPENRGGMSLEAAVDCEYLDNATRLAAKTILKTWECNKLALDSPEIQDWILQVLGYFRGCYNLLPWEEAGWNVSALTISQLLDPMEYIGQHAGVHLIRRYYPEFAPTPEQFTSAYWGTKP